MLDVEPGDQEFSFIYDENNAELSCDSSMRNPMTVRAKSVEELAEPRIGGFNEFNCIKNENECQVKLRARK